MILQAAVPTKNFEFFQNYGAPLGLGVPRFGGMRRTATCWLGPAFNFEAAWLGGEQQVACVVQLSCVPGYGRKRHPLYDQQRRLDRGSAGRPGNPDNADGDKPGSALWLLLMTGDQSLINMAIRSGQAHSHRGDYDPIFEGHGADPPWPQQVGETV